MICIWVPALVLIWLYLYNVWKHYSYWSRQKVNGPTPLPIFGNMFEYFKMKKHFGEVFDDIYRLVNASE